MNKTEQNAPHQTMARAADILRRTPDKEIAGRLAEFFSAFADNTRVRIISALQAAGELSVGDIAQIVGASESAVSHQLKLLRLLRLVTYRSEGRMAYYRLDDAHIEKILRAGMDHIREQGSR